VNQINNGGPAFPVNYSNEMDAPTVYPTEGMTLRDYFAAKAMPLAMERLRLNYTRDMGDEWSWKDTDWEFIADRAYDMADAMLHAREANE